jgi:hypothetical protein
MGPWVVPAAFAADRGQPGATRIDLIGYSSPCGREKFAMPRPP